MLKGAFDRCTIQSIW